LKPKLVKGTGGVFDIAVGDDLIFSKKRTGRFPQPGEVETALRQKLA
jgi:selT/selW/selH-like putative selenoprotein